MVSAKFAARAAALLVTAGSAGGGRIYGGLSVRSDRQLRPVVYRCHGVGCINVAILMLFALRIRNRSQGLEVGDKTKNGEPRLAVFVR